MFALHTQKCLRWLETSVLHSSPLYHTVRLFGTELDTHTHTNSRNPDFGCGQILVTLTNLVAS